MTAIDSAARSAAQKQLHAAVDALTLPIDQALPDPDPWQTPRVKLPCLLDQLADATQSSSSRGGASRNRHSAPLALDVVILLAEIDRALYRGLAGTKTTPRGRPALMRAWAARSGHWRANGPAYLVYAASLATQWLDKTRAILAAHPATREPYGAPCPHCHATTVFVVSPEGDQRVQRSALYLDTEQVSVTCRACGDGWPTNHLNFLAAVLEDGQRSSLTTGSKSESLSAHR
jgi:hypothetical protein